MSKLEYIVAGSHYNQVYRYANEQGWAHYQWMWATDEARMRGLKGLTVILLPGAPKAIAERARVDGYEMVEVTQANIHDRRYAGDLVKPRNTQK